MTATTLQTVLSALHALTESKLKEIDEQYAAAASWVATLTKETSPMTRETITADEIPSDTKKIAANIYNSEKSKPGFKENGDDMAVPKPRSRPRKSAAKRVFKKTTCEAGGDHPHEAAVESAYEPSRDNAGDVASVLPGGSAVPGSLQLDTVEEEHEQDQRGDEAQDCSVTKDVKQPEYLDTHSASDFGPEVEKNAALADTSCKPKKAVEDMALTTPLAVNWESKAKLQGQPAMRRATRSGSQRTMLSHSAKARSLSLSGLATPRDVAGVETGQASRKKSTSTQKRKTLTQTPASEDAPNAQGSGPGYTNPQSPEPGMNKDAQSSLGKRQSQEETPLQELSEELLTAKTVSTRKKRPKTPYDFTFDISASLTFPCGGLEAAGHASAASSAALPSVEPAQDDQILVQEEGDEGTSPPSDRLDKELKEPTLLAQDTDAGDVSIADAKPDVAPNGEQEVVLKKSVNDDLTNALETGDSITEPDGRIPSLPSNGNKPGGSGSDLCGSSGNLVTSVRSFVPLVKCQYKAPPPPAAGKTKSKVKALEAAENARRAAEEKEKERAKRLEALKLRREQNKAGGIGVSKLAAAGAGPKPPSRLGPGAHGVAKSAAYAAQQAASKARTQRRMEDEAARKTRDEQERRERQERIKRMREQREKIREDEAGRKADGISKKPVPTTTSGIPGVTKEAIQPMTVTGYMAGKEEGNIDLQYEISPYKSASDSDSDEEDDHRSRKPIPRWAMTHNLVVSLKAQEHIDPDEIFQQKHIKTCNLEDMFRDISGRSYSRRGSTGNWIEDRVTWQEELAYKKSMGFRSVC